MIKKMDLYLSREVLLPVFLALLLFPSMMLLDAAFSLQNLFLNKKPPADLYFKMLFLKVPAFFVLALPVAALFGTIMALHRMARDHEVLAFRMGGISFYRIMFPFFFLAFLFSLFSFALNEIIVPKSNHASQNIVRKLVLSKSVPIIQENILFQGGNNQHFYAHRYEAASRTLYGIAVYEIASEKYPRTITAQRGKLFSDAWVLEDGVVHHFQKNGFLDYEAHFDKLRIPVEFNLAAFVAEQRTPQEMVSQQLKKKIQLFKKGGVDTRALETDYFFKFSIPFACLIVTLLGAPLSVFFSRSGSFIGLGLSVILVLVYYSLMATSRQLGFNGVLPPLIAAWLPNFVFGVAGVALAYKVEH